ncbi:13E12 repeat family protein [Mycobacterium sp. NBC_00419]|uniref:13E12 repeat family protein n=1 Tax=Mycobacterium sp. NBC_00419 TaxID=2975989 RepID=UPI002E1E8B3F
MIQVCGVSAGAPGAFGDLGQALTRLSELDLATLTPREIVPALESLQLVRNALPAVEHQLLATLQRQTTPGELGDAPTWAVWLRDLLLLSSAEARRRVDHAKALGPRTSLTGQPLGPELPATAAAQADGLITEAHVAVMTDFADRIPEGVDPEEVAEAEANLAELAAAFTPEELRTLVTKQLYCWNQDGQFTDVDRAKKRGIVIGKQGPDGMSRIAGWLTPAMRAKWEAALKKEAAPGHNIPGNPTAVGAETTEDQIKADTRTPAQRTHDAMEALLTAFLAADVLGTHRGLPVKLIIRADLADLEARTGHALTSSGSMMPISDVIALLDGKQAHHYLAIFQGAKSLQLNEGRSKRLATAAQRLMLFARDGGSTRPGSTTPFDHCEVNHNIKWAAPHNGPTDIDGLSLMSGPDNRILEKGGYTVTLGKGGIEWRPSRRSTRRRPPRNYYFNPHQIVKRGDGADDTDPP